MPPAVALTLNCHAAVPLSRFSNIDSYVRMIGYIGHSNAQPATPPGQSEWPVRIAMPSGSSDQHFSETLQWPLSLPNVVTVTR